MLQPAQRAQDPHSSIGYPHRSSLATAGTDEHVGLWLFGAQRNASGLKNHRGLGRGERTDQVAREIRDQVPESPRHSGAAIDTGQ